MHYPVLLQLTPDENQTLSSILNKCDIKQLVAYCENHEWAAALIDDANKRGQTVIQFLQMVEFIFVKAYQGDVTSPYAGVKALKEQGYKVDPAAPHMEWVNL